MLTLDINKESDIWYAVYNICCTMLGDEDFEFLQDVEGEADIENIPIQCECPECDADIEVEGSANNVFVELKNVLIQVSPETSCKPYSRHEIEQLRDLALKRSTENG